MLSDALQMIPWQSPYNPDYPGLGGNPRPGPTPGMPSFLRFPKLGIIKFLNIFRFKIVVIKRHALNTKILYLSALYICILTRNGENS